MKSTNLIPRRMREQICDVGIGGWKCYCCRPDKKTVDTLNRRIRHILKLELNKEIKEEGELE